MPRFPRRRARCATGGRSARITPPMPGFTAPAPLPAAARIDVGQPLAGDADAVTPLDALTVRNGMAQALAPVGPGDGVLSAGADVAAGAVLMEAGRRLARPQIEVLAAAGVAAVRVRAPRLRLVRVAVRAATPSSMPRSPASPMPSEPRGGVAVTDRAGWPRPRAGRSSRRCDRGGGRHRQRPERRHGAHACIGGRGVRARHRPAAGRDHGFGRNRLPTGAGVAGPARCGARGLAHPGPAPCWRGSPAAASRNARGPPSSTHKVSSDRGAFGTRARCAARARFGTPIALGYWPLGAPLAGTDS